MADLNQLLGLLREFAQPVIDSFQSDVSDIKEGRMPRQAVRAVDQAMSAPGVSLPAGSVPEALRSFGPLGNKLASVGDFISSLKNYTRAPAPVMAAKEFKSAPAYSNVEGYISQLAKEGRGVNLNGLLASIRNPKTREVMTGGTGMGRHPWDYAPATFTERGFAPPDLQQGGFMTDLLATSLQNPKMVALADKFLKSGKSLDEVTKIIVDAASFGR